MGQESLNFEEQPRRINRTPNISEIISKSEIAQARAIEARLSKEKKYKFLEDVPEQTPGETQRKIQKFNFIKFLNDERKQNFFYDGMAAAMEVRDLNDKYGYGSAAYVTSSDGAGRVGHKILYNRPLRPEFEDILDINGNILPSKDEYGIAS